MILFLLKLILTLFQFHSSIFSMLNIVHCVSTSRIYTSVAFFKGRSFHRPKKWKLNEAVGRGQYLFLRSMKTHIERYKLLYLCYLCDKVCQWLAAGWLFSPGPPVSSTYKAYRHGIVEVESGVKDHKKPHKR
jgi:hypothetical protein